jgi:hypothetical protein
MILLFVSHEVVVVFLLLLFLSFFFFGLFEELSCFTTKYIDNSVKYNLQHPRRHLLGSFIEVGMWK